MTLPWPGAGLCAGIRPGARLLIYHFVTKNAPRTRAAGSPGRTKPPPLIGPAVPSAHGGGGRCAHPFPFQGRSPQLRGILALKARAAPGAARETSNPPPPLLLLRAAGSTLNNSGFWSQTRPVVQVFVLPAAAVTLHYSQSAK